MKAAGGKFKALLFIFASLLPRSHARVEVESLTDRTIYHFHLERPVFRLVEVRGVPLWQASLPGAHPFEAVLYEIGRPELPAARLFLDGEGEISVRVGEAQDFPPPGDSHRLKPALAPTPKGGAPPPRLLFDEAVYAIDELQPAVTFDIEEVGYVAGVRRRQVTLFPLRYNPVTGESRFLSEMAVELKHGGDVPSVPAFIENETLVVVVGDRFAESKSLREYAAFKNTLGYRVRWLKVSEGQTPEEIREKLRSWYASESPLSHVLIVGARDEVPGFPSSLMENVTDHHYASLDTPDYEQDVATPDVGVGRLIAQSEAELAALLEKLVRYQRGEAPVTEADLLEQPAQSYCALREPRPLPWVAPRACVAKVFGVDEWREPSHTIASWGALDSTFVEEDAVLERRLKEGMRLPGKLVFGDLTRWALGEVWRHYGGAGLSRYYWETYVTLGDPSVSLRTTDTRDIKVDGPRVLPVGTSEITLYVSDLQGHPISGARVGLSAPNRDYRISGQTDVLGRIHFELSEGYWGANEFQLTVSGENIRLWEGKLKFVEFAPGYHRVVL